MGFPFDKIFMQNLKAKLSQVRNKIKPISLGVFNLFIALWLGIILNIGFYEKVNELTPYQGFKERWSHLFEQLKAYL